MDVVQKKNVEVLFEEKKEKGYKNKLLLFRQRSMYGKPGFTLYRVRCTVVPVQVTQKVSWYSKKYPSNMPQLQLVFLAVHTYIHMYITRPTRLLTLNLTSV